MNILKNAMKRKTRHIEQFKHMMPGGAMRIELKTLEIMRKIHRGAYSNEPIETLKKLIESLCASAERNTKRDVFWYAVRTKKLEIKNMSFYVTNFNIFYKSLKRLKRRPESKNKSNYCFSGVVLS